MEFGGDGTTMKTIMHLDMNSYFATAEQQANPGLRGRPVGIVKAAGRGCVIAASVEAKKFGVKTGATVWEARRLCPQIVLVPADMEKYFSLTQKLLGVVDEYSDRVEVFSIDEVFLDVSESQRLWGGGTWQMALEIKARIKAELGEWMRASVGVSFTKLLAKLAGEMYKPDGLTFLMPEDYLEKTAEVEVGAVCGIGRARTVWLEERGARTLGQARQLPGLPKETFELVWLTKDEELVTRVELEPAKSVGRTFTTFEELTDEGKVLRLVRNLVEEVSAKLREMGMAGRTLGLMLSGTHPHRYGGVAGGFWARKTLKTPTDDGQIIFSQLWRGYERRPLLPVRFAGVGVSNLTFKQQELMFGHREELLRVVDAVNERWGLFTLYPAVLRGSELIRPEVTGYLGDKYYRFRSGRG